MGQAVATPAGIIIVTVRDATTNAAIARASVKIAPRGYGTSTSGRVDRQGQVVFDDILPDTYTVSVSAPGYDLRAVPRRADSILPDARPDRQRITVSAGSRTQVDFVLRRGGRLTSTVTAASGGPAGAIPIELFAAGQASAGHALPFLGLWPPATVTTGADGVGVIDGLPDGRFYLRAVLPGTLGRSANYVYAPGVTAAADAVPIDVRQSEDVLAALSLPVPSVSRVSGRVVTPAGVPVAGADIYLVSIDGAGAAALAPVARSGRSGTFDLRGVGPGTYSLQAVVRTAAVAPPGTYSMQEALRAREGAPAVLVGSREIQVLGAPLNGLSLTAVPPAHIEGRIVFNGQEAADPGRTEILVLPDSDEARQRALLTPRPEWHADGRFTIDGIVGLHRLEARLSPGWYLQGVLLDDGTNVTWAAFDFQPGRLYANVRAMVSSETATVVVRVPARRTDGPVLLTIFPEDSGLWGRGEGFVQSAVIDGFAAVEHRFSGLVPSLTYLVAAGPIPEDALWLARPDAAPVPELAARVPGASRVNVWGPDDFSVSVNVPDR